MPLLRGLKGSAKTIREFGWDLVATLALVDVTAVDNKIDQFTDQLHWAKRRLAVSDDWRRCMKTKAEKSRLTFQTIVWPIRTGTARPSSDELHSSLLARRRESDRAVAKLARRIDEVAKGAWTLFKSIKPFTSTPNDTDWFPFEAKRHKELIDHLCTPGGGAKWMEWASPQTTLIEDGGEGVTYTIRKGDVYYTDCYVAPSTDYFIYPDPRRMRGMTEITEVEGYEVSVLQPHAELTSILFHNGFPEKGFTIESYYLVKRYLDLIEERGTLDAFVGVCREQKVEYAAAVNLYLTSEISRVQFGQAYPRITRILDTLGYSNTVVPGFGAAGALLYACPSSAIWHAFLSKLRNGTSFKSALNQFVHMLNPVFFIEFLRVVWRRTILGGVYEQN